MPDAAPSTGFLFGFPDPTWSTCPDGLVLSWNPAAERTFGLRAGEALGRPAAQVLGPHPWVAGPVDVVLAHPDRPPVRGALRTWTQAPGGVRHHTLAVADPGVTAGPEGSRRPLEEPLEHVADAIVTLDAAGVVLSLNAGAARTAGIPRADVVGHPLADLVEHVGRTSRHEFATMVPTLRTGRTWFGADLLVTTRDGRQLLLDASATPLVDAAGAYAGAVLVARDVTPVRELEQSLRAAARVLHGHADELTQASHRDPLTGVAGRSLLQERLSAALRTAARTGEPVSVLVTDLDGFRAVNDSYGLAAGDAVLSAFAAHLLAGLPPTATAGRLGADEFAVVLPATGAARAGELADRLAGWRPPAPLPRRGRRAEDEAVGVTVGVVQALDEECRSTFETGARSVLVRAETAVSRAKAARRG